MKELRSRENEAVRVGDEILANKCYHLAEAIRKRYNESAKVPIPKDGDKISTGRLYLEGFSPYLRKD
jgi:hypothetical protein